MNANPARQPDSDQQIVDLYLAMSLFQQGKKEEALKLYDGVAPKVSAPPSVEAPLLNSIDAGGGALVLWLALREAGKLFAETEGAGSPLAAGRANFPPGYPETAIAREVAMTRRI